ncbi:uncharacterized protein [Spinacia oleracea]|uniref:Uncharacterized protein n=1 Tax=Spinacia oleracea TaxID=3562 RepID=A0ABM3QRT7_SPIOL|nr:uncharacterized protein LOC130461859 [Spinacia oleracea]
MPCYNTATLTLISYFILLLSSVLLNDLPSASALDCTPGHECDYAHLKPTHNLYFPNRKILMGLSKEERPNYAEEWRKVPSGPDPLHHSGGPQKRPRTSP